MIKILIFAAIILVAYLLIRKFLSANVTMSSAEACKLLEVAPDADAETINAAHRRLIAKVHPDAGGTAELAAQINTARDVLLRRLPK